MIGRVGLNRVVLIALTMVCASPAIVHSVDHHAVILLIHHVQDGSWVWVCQPLLPPPDLGFPLQHKVPRIPKQADQHLS